MFSSPYTFRDRLCIATNATTDILISEQQLVSCNLYGLEACNGGDPVTALRYIAMYGLPSGMLDLFLAYSEPNVSPTLLAKMEAYHLVKISASTEAL